jgi:hypothetical protein
MGTQRQIIKEFVIKLLDKHSTDGEPTDGEINSWVQDLADRLDLRDIDAEEQQPSLSSIMEAIDDEPGAS